MAVMDLIVACIVLLILSVSLLFGSVLLDRVGERDIINGTIAETHITNTKQALFAFNDWFPFVFAGMIVAIAIGAYFMQTHPVFLVAAVVILIIFIMISGIMVNSFHEFAGAEVFADVVDEYDNVTTMWDHMPLLLLIAAIPILIALYGKRGTSNAGQGPVY